MTRLRELWEKLRFNSDPDSLTEAQIQALQAQVAALQAAKH